MKKFKIAIFWTVFPLALFFALQYLIRFVMIFLAQFSKDPRALIASAGFNFAYTFLFFVAYSAAIYWLPQKIFKYKILDRDLGLMREITWTDLGLGVAGFVASLIAGGIILGAVEAILPGFDANQEQSLGFRGLFSPLDHMLAFVSIAILPPIAEEFIFRGVIYGQLRKVGVFFAVIWTSLLFGFVHLQLNVGVVVFVMSLVMCLIREKLTDSIWAGVVIHFLKNSIAFILLYFVVKR